jgi:hypothetical protein
MDAERHVDVRPFFLGQIILFLVPMFGAPLERCHARFKTRLAGQGTIDIVSRA